MLVKICSLPDVPENEARQFNIGEMEILVINLKGQFHCLAARCTHAGAPLVEGEIQDDVLICPWHYSNFRITDGSVVEGPAEKPLPIYPSKISQNNLFIEL